jgi:hypothetical protein
MAVEAALAQQRRTDEVSYLRLLIFMLDFRGDYLLVHSIYRSRDDTALFKIKQFACSLPANASWKRFRPMPPALRAFAITKPEITTFKSMARKYLP